MYIPFIYSTGVACAIGVAFGFGVSVGMIGGTFAGLTIASWFDREDDV